MHLIERNGYPIGHLPAYPILMSHNRDMINDEFYMNKYGKLFYIYLLSTIRKCGHINNPIIVLNEFKCTICRT